MRTKGEQPLEITREREKEVLGRSRNFLKVMASAAALAFPGNSPTIIATCKGLIPSVQLRPLHCVPSPNSCLDEAGRSDEEETHSVTLHHCNGECQSVTAWQTRFLWLPGSACACV